MLKRERERLREGRPEPNKNTWVEGITGEDDPIDVFPGDDILQVMLLL